MPKHILFVDDEPLVLAGLRRSLRSMRDVWQMEFLSTGEEALQVMENVPFDVIVTDMRMPGMDGAQLLKEVERRHPRCMRIVLSGHSEEESVLRTVTLAHQFVSKPCNPEEIKQLITRAFALDDLLDNARLKEVLSRLKSVPSLPFLYLEVIKELQTKEPSIGRVVDTISGDMGMAAKILQLVNSAFFGLQRSVSSLTQAVCLLGLDTIKALVLSAHIFSSFDRRMLRALDLQWIWERSFLTAECAKAVAKCEGANASVVDDAFTAGLLQDTGALVLASALPSDYDTVLKLAASEQLQRWQAEQEVLGCSHAEVGAYLFTLWGLPTAINEAVAWHHRPGDSPISAFCPLLALHAGSVCCQSTDGSRGELVEIDQDLLARCKLSEHIGSWQKSCAKVSVAYLRGIGGVDR